MEQQIDKIMLEITEQLKDVKTVEDCLSFRNKFIGKNGSISELSRSMKDLSAEEKPKAGMLINKARVYAEESISSKEKDIKQAILNQQLMNEKIDVSINKAHRTRGSYHPFTIEFDRWCEILTGMGFSQIEGPEIDYDKYNFELLNIPKEHPSRDMQDSYFITPEILLRTQTSNTQPRAMQKLKPPFKVFSYGMCFRKDDIDATHTASFNQLEGIYIDKNVGLADLKIMLELAIKKYFGEKSKIRFRSSFFPFTEPSVEVDLTCPKCDGKGCKDCKFIGGYEILGAGMIHPKVLEMNGIDSKIYSGYAFGFGFDRFPKGKYNVSLSSLFYENDIRFLRQFK